MNNSECPFDAAVIHAVRIGSWSNELREHLASCSRCTETAALCASLAEFAEVGELPESLLSPHLLWLKARVIRSQRRSARLDLALTVGMGLVGIFAALALIAWVYPPALPLFGRSPHPEPRGLANTLWVLAPFLATGGLLYGLRLLNPTHARIKGMV